VDKRALPNSVVCPNCGDFVDYLIVKTGWCRICSYAGSVLVNKLEQYLAANADEIEHYLLQGKSLNKAIDLVHSKNGRPHCLSCGRIMDRAPRNAVFCRATKQCRKFSRRYVYLYREKGMTKHAALAKVLEDLNG